VLTDADHGRGPGDRRADALAGDALLGQLAGGERAGDAPDPVVGEELAVDVAGQAGQRVGGALVPDDGPFLPCGADAHELHAGHLFSGIATIASISTRKPLRSAWIEVRAG